MLRSFAIGGLATVTSVWLAATESISIAAQQTFETAKIEQLTSVKGKFSQKDGDFVMMEKELQPVLKAVHGGGINIVAIHNHIEAESPRVVFLHWGVGPTADLARGLKAASGHLKNKPNR